MSFDRQKALQRDTMSRLVQTLSPILEGKNVPTAGHRDGTSILHVGLNDPSLDKLEVPSTWVVSLKERFATFRDLNLRRDKRSKEVESVNLISLLLADEVETASKVVATLWSALDASWGISEKDSGISAANWRQLIHSSLWYVPLCGPEQEFIPFLKYQLSYLFAKAERQVELPERPVWLLANDGHVLSGWLGMFFRSRCYGLKLKQREWRNTVLHGIKKGLPQMGPFWLVKNCEAMRNRLSKKVETDGEMLEQIERTGREIFPRGILYEDWNKVDPYVGVSDHACYEKTRSERGVLGQLYELDDDCEAARQLSPTQFFGMYYDPSNNSTGEIRAPAWTPDVAYSREQRYSLFDDDRARAYVKPIYEPLKIRMISAGDYRSNGLFQRLQKKLWSGLQRFKQFSLTGKTVENSDLEWIRLKTFRPKMRDDQLTWDNVFNGKTDQFIGMPCFDEWVSGDYSAATDNLNQDACREAALACSGDPITAKVLLRGLMNTEISFAKVSKDRDVIQKLPDDFVMSNGQLMGSVFSFPLLCIINLAVYRASLEEYMPGVSFRIGDLPAFCNGDDILFKTDDRFYDIWCKNIKRVGFEKSLGKNYKSESTAIINSQYFAVDEPNPVFKIPYLNMGWCTGVQKGGGENLVDDWETDYPIMKLGSQMETVFDQWIVSEEFKPADRPEKLVERRSAIYLRFREEIRQWNWEKIIKTGAIAGSGPMGLCLTDQLREEEERFSYYAYLHQESGKSFGLDSFPKTLAPWKIVQRSKETNFFDLRNEFKKVTKKWSWERLIAGYLGRLTASRERQFEEARFVLGELPGTPFSEIHAGQARALEELCSELI